MKLKEIIAVLEEFAPPALQESYDNAGLITGNPEMEITEAMLCLDATEEVIEEAIQTKCNLVIAHHPIIFSGLKKITGSNYVERVIIRAIKNDIAIYAAHTNLDNVHYGVNKKICERLQLRNTRILSPLKGKLMKLFTFAPNEHALKVREALFAAGAGMIGNYDECSFNSEGYGTFRGNDETNPFVGAKGIQHREEETKIEVIFPGWLQSKIVSALKESHPYEEVAYDVIALSNDWANTGAGMIGELEHPMVANDFLSFLKEKMNTQTIRYTKFTARPDKSGTHDSRLTTIAVCGGAGSFLLKDAINAKADAFVTGDFKYHQFFDAENKIMICDIGHYESEQFTPGIFAEVLRRKFPTFATRFTSINTNPIKYY
ncbi:MAG TPA: Nif3-like dinuclear metal center hexameric protein [Chitinophagales bacterium]|nr:Nif3-like dinuclear metal center hexameric protein [Chitinophagales bacterium]